MDENKGRVVDFKKEEQLMFLRGMCFNNATVLLGACFAGNRKDIVSIKDVYDYAEKLFDEGVKRDYPNYMPKGTAKAEPEGSIKNPITGKELVI